MMDFEDYLKRAHYLGYLGHKGPDLDKAYRGWVAELDTTDLISYANAWGRFMIDEFDEKVLPGMEGQRYVKDDGDFSIDRLQRLAEANGFNRCRRLIKARMIKFRGV